MVGRTLPSKSPVATAASFCLINFEGVVLFFVDRVCVLVV
jgi:hypothetical protein